MNVTEISNALISGLAVGGTYAFLALAYALIFSTTRVFNLAEAQFMVLGGLLGHTLLVEHHWNWAVAAVVVMVIVAGVGIVQEFVTVKPITSGFGWILTTLGASFILQALYGKWYGADPLPVSGVISSSAHRLGSIRYVPSQLLAVVTLLVLVGGIELYSRRSRLGKAWRATSQNPATASTLGINPRRVIVVVFAGAGAVAALGGLMTSPTTYAAAYGGDLIGFMSFLAVAVGGMATTGGAVLGGLLLGMVESLSLYFIGAQFNLALVFGLILIFLLIRPHGLVSAGAEREV